MGTTQEIGLPLIDWGGEARTKDKDKKIQVTDPVDGGRRAPRWLATMAV